jgi:hypothetical protein
MQRPTPRRLPDFTRLWTSQTISQLGSQVTTLALPRSAQSAQRVEEP